MDSRNARPAPGTEKTKGKLRRKSVIKLKANTSNSGIAKSVDLVSRLQSCFKI